MLRNFETSGVPAAAIFAEGTDSLGSTHSHDEFPVRKELPWQLLSLGDLVLCNYIQLIPRSSCFIIIWAIFIFVIACFFPENILVVRE